MQTLRKKNSPRKFKYEPTRFLGDGISFKAKLIGILEVSEASGNGMCQAALADLKMAIRAAGEHKQRIAVQVSIDGIRLKDEKTGETLYHHPVHKISFISQDKSDTRAFGYIFGSPDTGHRFFGIKTEKAAVQLVIAMRDLFQVVFDLKKKEIEIAKQHIEQNAINAIKFHTGGMFVEPAPDTKGAAGSESTLHRIRAANSETEKPAAKNESQGGVIADLLDLQFELNSLQQGIHQMDKITPENPVPTADDLFETDPFGDSFANMKLKETVRPILPPPPSSSKRGHLERQQTVPAQAGSNSSSPAANLSSKTPPPQSSIHWFDKETENLFNEGELARLTKGSAIKKEDEISLSTTAQPAVAKSPQIDVFTELDPLGTGLIKPYVDKKDFFQHLKNPPKKVLKDLVPTSSSDTFPTNFAMSEPLEPTTTTNGSLSLDSNAFDDTNFANFDRFDENEALQSATTRADSPMKEPVQRIAHHHHQSLSVNLPPEEPAILPKPVASAAPSAPVHGSIARMEKDSTESIQSLVKLPSPKKYLQQVRKREFDMDLNRGQSIDKPFPVDFAATSDSPASPLRSCSSDANSRLSSSSAELDLVPEPPPRGAGSILLNPPPLPPKKQGARGMKPPPRPPYTDGHFHYDFPEREEASPSPTRSKDRKSPSRDTRSQFDDNFSPPPRIQSTDRSDIIGTMTTSAFEDSFSNMIPTTNLSTFFTSTTTQAETRKAKPSLDITLSQLTSSNLDELAATLGMTVQELAGLTLQQLTECLAGLSANEAAKETQDVPKKAEPVVSVQTHVQPPAVQSVQSVSYVQPGQPVQPVQSLQTVQSVQSIEQHPSAMEVSKPSTEPLFKTTFDQEPKQEPTYDKYAVLRELYEMEQMKEKSKAVEEEEEDEYEEEEQNEQEEEEFKDEEEEAAAERRDSEDVEQQLEVFHEAGSDSIASLVNLTVKLPPLETSLKETIKDEVEAKEIQASEDSMEEEKASEQEESVKEISASPRLEEIFEDARPTLDTEERLDVVEKDVGVSLEKSIVTDSAAEETNGSSIVDKVEVKSSTSTSSDKYAALREFIGEPEPAKPKPEESMVSPRQPSPIQLVTNSLAEVELSSLFSDVPPASSPKKTPRKEEDLKSVAMDIFEEIQMLNTGASRSRADTKSASSSGFEDVFCPFGESRPENRDDKEENWAKFDTGVFGSDRSSCEGPRSVGGTSPWSPDGKEFHREASFKGASGHRHSGDSDNEWKDEEESEESNGRMRDRFYCGRHARFDAPFDERSFYEDVPSDKRERGFRERAGRKSRGTPWSKSSTHRPRDPSPWHEEGQWEGEPRRYPHRKMPYKDDEEQYEPHWKCRPKPQRWNWSHEHNVSGTSGFYDDERKRKLMLWNEEDRFGSEESMGYEEDDRWSRRKYERRRWEDDSRFWGRRPPPEADYPMRDYYYYRDSRGHEYSGAWEEDYGPERPGDDSPRYNTARKRHWPKRPNSANEGRNSDMAYGDPRKFRASRSECSDNDSDPYLRPSQRSRSRESYWGSDQEFDSWAERPCWSEGPDSKSETMHRKRIARHKPRQSQAKAQSPFEDECAQGVENIVSPAGESSASAPDSARSRPETEPKRESAREGALEGPLSPSPRGSKDRRDPQRDYFKRSSYFENDLTPSASSDASDVPRQRLPEFKATPEELPAEKEPHRSMDGFAAKESGDRDSFFNGDLRFEDESFAFKAEMEDSVPEHHRATTLPVKSSRQNKYAPAAGNNNNNSKTRADQYIRKSESVNIFVRENDPFDDDDFFN